VQAILFLDSLWSTLSTSLFNLQSSPEQPQMVSSTWTQSAPLGSTRPIAKYAPYSPIPSTYPSGSLPMNLPAFGSSQRARK